MSTSTLPVYFYSIARSIVNSSNFGQLFLFYISLIAAFFTAALKLVQYSNVAAKESLTLIQKCTLFFYFLFSLLARCASFLCSLTLPALNINHFLQNQAFKEKPELQNFLSDVQYRKEFNTYRVIILDDIFNGI